MEFTAREASLLIIAGQKKHTIEKLEEALAYQDSFMVKMVIEGKMNCIELRKYLMEHPLTINVYVESKCLGLTTVIKEYTNKNGVTSLAHFSHHDKYLGSVKAMGNKPISYKGYFSFKKYGHLLKYMYNKEAKLLSDFFFGN
jgi:hypothetical protein